MKNFRKLAVVVMMVFAMAFTTFPSAAQSGLTDMLGNMLQGVFSKSNLSVYDVCGQWTSQGSAVSFQSENLLKKAGGQAAAGIIENKINPYFEKLGLNNAVLTIEADSTFSLKTKNITLKGSISSNGDGTFQFKFKAFSAISLGSVKTYVQKSGDSMDVMFDAKKLMSIVSDVAKVTGISIAKTMASVLDSYDGLCVGFSMKKTGDVQMPEGYNNSSNSGLGGLLNGVLGGKNSSQATDPTPSESNSQTKTSEQSKYTTIGGGMLKKEASK